MKNRADIKALQFFEEYFFWDCRADKILINQDRNFIIERVLDKSFDLARDLRQLDKLYSKKAIVNVALNSQQIFGNENIEFIANWYNLNPCDFCRYIENIKERNKHIKLEAK